MDKFVHVKADKALFLAHKQILASCCLFSPHHLCPSYLRQDNQRLGNSQVILFCLVRLCCLSLVGKEVDHDETRSHTAPTVGCTPSPMERTYSQLWKPFVRDFIVKTALENCSGKYGIFLVICSQWYQVSLMPTS